MKRNVKIFCAALALVLVFGVVVGGTIAWLQDTTETITNTFTVGDVSITLTEGDNLDLKMIPGKVITKDPTITVGEDSEDCFVFIKVEKANDFDSYMEFGVEDGWVPLGESAPGVYFYENGALEAKTSMTFLKDNQVTVKNTVTKAMMETANTAAPTLSFTAYAIQSAHLDTLDAASLWAEVLSGLPTETPDANA